MEYASNLILILLRLELSIMFIAIAFNHIEMCEDIKYTVIDKVFKLAKIG